MEDLAEHNGQESLFSTKAKDHPDIDNESLCSEESEQVWTIAEEHLSVVDDQFFCLQESDQTWKSTESFAASIETSRTSSSHAPQLGLELTEYEVSTIHLDHGHNLY